MQNYGTIKPKQQPYNWYFFHSCIAGTFCHNLLSCYRHWSKAISFHCRSHDRKLLNQNGSFLPCGEISPAWCFRFCFHCGFRWHTGHFAKSDSKRTKLFYLHLCLWRIFKRNYGIRGCHGYSCIRSKNHRSLVTYHYSLCRQFILFYFDRHLRPYQPDLYFTECKIIRERHFLYYE